MAGYVIHLAIGEEFIRLHPDEVKDYDAFIEGIISPDGVPDKSLTHYGPKTCMVNLKEYFNDKDIKIDFDKGYFLHLVTDYLFYNKFLEKFSKNGIHEEYDVINAELENEFKVKIPKKIKDRVFYKEGKTEILDLQKTIKFIKDVAKYNLEDIKTAVINGDENWLKIRPLDEIRI